MYNINHKEAKVITTLTVNATDFKNKFGEYLKAIYTKKERITIEKSGLPVLVAMSYQDYEELVDTVESFLLYSKPDVQAQIKAGEEEIIADKGTRLSDLVKKKPR